MADVAGAPGQGTDTESPARDADGSEAQAEDGAAGTDAAAPAAEERPVEEPGTKTGKKPAASEQRPAARRSRRAATSTRRRRTADSPEEASEERSSRLVGLDLGELERAAAAASASSGPDAASVAESLAVTADVPSPAPVGGESSDSPSERAASARAAVAGLSLALGIDAAAGEVEEELVTRRSVSAPSARSADGRTGGTPQEEAFGVEPEDAEPPHAPRTLAELEAILPNRS